MKLKVFAIIALAIAMIFTLAACDSTGDKTADTTATAEKVTAAETTNATVETTIGETITTIADTTIEEATTAEDESTVEDITTVEEATTEETTTEEVTTEEGTTSILSEDEIALSLTKFAQNTQNTDSVVIKADLQVKMTIDTGFVKVPVVVPYTMLIKQHKGDMYMSMTDNFTFAYCGGVLYIDYPQVGKIKATMTDSQTAQFMGETGAENALQFTPEQMQTYFGEASGYKTSNTISIKLGKISEDFLNSIMALTASDTETETKFDLDNSYLVLTLGSDYSIKFITVSIAFKTVYEDTPVDATLSGKITYDTDADSTVTAPEDASDYLELTYEVLCAFLGIEPQYDEQLASSLGISKEQESLVLSTDPELFEKQTNFILMYGQHYLGKTVTMTGTYNETEIDDDIYYRTISMFEGDYYGVFGVDLNGNVLENDTVVTVTGEIVDLGDEEFHDYALKITSVGNK